MIEGIHLCEDCGAAIGFFRGWFGRYLCLECWLGWEMSR